MSNRRKIKRRALLAAARCPDCNSEARYAGRDGFGIAHVAVHHNETCPTYRRLQALGAAGLAQFRLLDERDS